MLCRQEGLEFVAFPVPDRDVPSSKAAVAELVAALEQLLQSGRNVVIHCRQGIGRSTLVAASLLVASGAEPDEAWRAVEEARGCSVPDTDAQRQWVADFASGLAPSRREA